MPDRPVTPPAGANDSARATSRRAVLSGVGSTVAAGSALAGGLAGSLAGCVALGTAGGNADAVEILAAGSLQRALGDGLAGAVDVPVSVEAHGSVTAARLVASGQRDPDVVALADTALFGTLLDAPWHATIATNSLVVAHTDGPDPHPIVAADRWFDPIVAGDVELGRTDPALDPLGYRTVFAFDLGATFYDVPGLEHTLRSRALIYPETSLVSRLEARAVGAAIVYRSMAADRDYPFVELPPAIDLGDPEQSYDAASYRLDDGTTVRGAPIRYGAWARHEDDRVRRVFETLAEGTVLAAHGFATPEQLPTYTGTVPKTFEG